MYHMENSDIDLLRDVNLPSSYLVDLEELGIEEVEPGVCLDTFTNRQLLRNNGITWQGLLNADGSPSDLIVAISEEAMKLKVLKKSEILTDVRDINSDFETGVDLLLIPDVNSMVPAWVLAATRKWNKTERERERTGKHITPHLGEAPGRCVAIKANGQRCRNWHGGMVKEGGLCRMHLSRTGFETNTTAKARNTVLSGAYGAASELENLLSATSEQVRLKAATEILDRAGIRGGIEVDQKVEIEIQPAKEMIAERLRKLSSNTPEKLEAAVLHNTDSDTTDEIQDAVVVDEENEHE